MTDNKTDIIDILAGIGPGDRLQALRDRRPVTREHAQKTYDALFHPLSTSDASLAERLAIATFVSQLHGEQGIAEFYASELAKVESGGVLQDALTAASKAGATNGPYGHYPAGPLTGEDVEGTSFVVPTDLAPALGSRLTAALEHVHLLVFHPRDAKPADLDRLLQAGWSTTGVVTISQLVSFLAFQIRVVAGLKVLSAA